MLLMIACPERGMGVPDRRYAPSDVTDSSPSYKYCLLQLCRCTVHLTGDKGKELKSRWWTVRADRYSNSIPRSSEYNSRREEFVLKVFLSWEGDCIRKREEFLFGMHFVLYLLLASTLCVLLSHTPFKPLPLLAQFGHT